MSVIGGADALATVSSLLEESSQLHARMATRDLSPVVAAAAAICRAVDRDGRVLVCGNGGSAAEAQHFVAEFVGRFARERRAIGAVALTTDTSILTALANDYAYERVFSRQVEALGRAGDVLVGISTSGTSPNVVDALTVAKSRGLTTVAVTGRDGGVMGTLADIHVNVPHETTARVQEVQLTLLHIICELVERHVVAAAPATA